MIQLYQHPCILKIVVLLVTVAICTSLANGIVYSLTGRMGALTSQPPLEGRPFPPHSSSWRSSLSLRDSAELSPDDAAGDAV